MPSTFVLYEPRRLYVSTRLSKYARAVADNDPIRFRATGTACRPVRPDSRDRRVKLHTRVTRPCSVVTDDGLTTAIRSKVFFSSAYDPSQKAAFIPLLSPSFPRSADFDIILQIFMFCEHSSASDEKKRHL